MCLKPGSSGYFEWELEVVGAYILNELDALARLMMWPKQFLVRFFLRRQTLKLETLKGLFLQTKINLLDAFHLWASLNLTTAGRSRRRSRRKTGPPLFCSVGWWLGRVYMFYVYLLFTQIPFEGGSCNHQPAISKLVLEYSHSNIPYSSCYRKSNGPSAGASFATGHQGETREGSQLEPPARAYREAGPSLGTVLFTLPHCIRNVQKTIDSLAGIV